MELLNKRVCAFVVVLDVAKLTSIEAAPVSTLAMSVGKEMGVIF